MKKDLEIVYGISNFLSNNFQKIFGWLEMPVTIKEFTKVLIDQTDFRIEAQHLN
jgi:predicted unusual protein kinase regulating ubiquinone biosynthesis (AarF/ABC1/UbiB family)